MEKVPYMQEMQLFYSLKWEIGSYFGSNWIFAIFFISFVYKLTDFGAARELEAHEVFMSVYGTEEYLVCQALIRFVYN